MLLDMIKKIIGQNHPEEVPVDVLQLLCDLETLRFDPPMEVQVIEEVLGSPVQMINDSAGYITFNNSKIYLYTFPFYQGNIYLGEYADRISLSNIHPDTGRQLDSDPPKDLPEAFLDRTSFLKAARLLALEDQSKITRDDDGFPNRELDIAYLTNF